MDDVTQLLTASTNAVWRMLPYAFGSGDAGAQFDNDWGFRTLLIDAEQAENQALVASFSNGASGNLTGGHAANSGRIVVRYALEPVS
jgi:hypothetical protein